VTAPLLRVRGRYPIEPGGKAFAPSVTAISGMVGPGEALAWGAAKETTLFGLHHRDEYEHLPLDEQYHLIRRHFKGVWNEKAARGTTVHNLAHQWAQGLEVDCPPECGPYLDALEQFYIDHQPQWSHCERSVIYDTPGREYGGSFDAAGVLKDGRSWLLDWKSGKRYPASVILQMSGYRYATELAVVDEMGQFVATEPMFEVDTCGVVYLHDDGTYELLELPVTPATHAVFLALRDVWTWQQEADAWLKKHPEPTRLAGPA
jgi:hypothetical protein